MPLIAWRSLMPLTVSLGWYLGVPLGGVAAGQRVPCWTIWIGWPSGSAVQAISSRPNHSCGPASSGAPAPTSFA
jgi:hypothetical protein